MQNNAKMNKSNTEGGLVTTVSIVQKERKGLLNFYVIFSANYNVKPKYRSDTRDVV